MRKRKQSSGRWVTRLLAVLLTVCMMNIPVQAVTLTEEEAARKGAEVFEAWDILNYSNYSYYINKYKSPYLMEVENHYNDPMWNAMLSAWKATTFNVSSGVKNAMQEPAAYAAFLFNILYDEKSNSVLSILESDCAENASTLDKLTQKIGVSTWRKVKESVDSVKDLSEPAAVEKVAKDLEKCGQFSNVMKAVGKELPQCIKNAKNVTKLVSNLSKAEAILRTSETASEIVEGMYHRAKPGPLKEELFEYSTILKKHLSKEAIMGIIAGTVVGQQAAENAADELYKLCIASMGKYGLMIETAQKVGKWSSDALFNTSDYIASYYKLTAMYQFEFCMKGETKARESAFRSNPTPETAKAFITAYKMMMETYIEGLECTDEYIKANYEDGLVNDAGNWVKRHVFNCEMDQHEQLHKDIAFMIKEIKETLDYVDTSSYNHFLDVVNLIAETDKTDSPVTATGTAPIQPVTTEEQYTLALIDVTDRSYALSNHTYSKDVVLQEDLTTRGDITITGGTFDCNGHSVSVGGNFKLEGGTLNLNGGTVAVQGDAVLCSDLNLWQGTLTINGDVRHEAGRVDFNKGKMTVGGNYRMETKTTDQFGETQYLKSDGRLYMEYPEDYFKVGGSFYQQGWNTNTLSAGTMEVQGDFTADNRFFASGTHTTVLSGTGTQKVRFTDSSGCFCRLALDQAADVVFTGNVKIGCLMSDGAAHSQGGRLYGLHLNSHSLEITGDMVIAGDLNLWQGTLTINGDVRHEAGRVDFNKGKMTVGGNYRMETMTLDQFGETQYLKSDGRLYMEYPEDYFKVGGSFYLYGTSNTPSAGTMEVQGDFTADNRFFASGTHTTVLSGTQIQHVTFTNGGRFNILDLRQPTSQYVFSPDPCWNKLYEVPEISDVEVSSVILSARKKAMTVGETYQLTAAAYPDNATDPSLTWSSSDPRVAEVDQTGLVHALKAGKTSIRATASNGIYRTCVVTVNEVFSGVLTTGTVCAMPGDVVSIPVTIWDNPGIAAARLTLTYDPDILTPVAIHPGAEFSQGRAEFSVETPGTCTMLWYSSTDTKNSGVLLTLDCQVSETAALDRSVVLSLSSKYGDICNEHHDNVGFSTENGALLIRKVLPGDIYEDEKVDPHDIVELQKYLTDLAVFSDRQKAAADLDQNGVVDMRDIVLLAKKLVNKPVAAQLLQELMTEPQTLQISFADAEFDANGYAVMPVSFSNSTGISALRLQLLYDDSVLELVEIEPVAPALDGKLCTNLSDVNRTRTLVTWYSDSDQVFDGSVFNLKFRVRDADFRGTSQVSAAAQEHDVCTEALYAVPTVTSAGLLSGGNDDGIRIDHLDVTDTGTSLEIHCNVACAEDVSGTSALLCAAAYDPDGRMLAMTQKQITLLPQSQYSLEMEKIDYHRVRVFLLDGQTFAPLAPEALY